MAAPILKPKFPSLAVFYAVLMLGLYVIPTGGLHRMVRSSMILRLLMADATLHFLSFALLTWLLCRDLVRPPRLFISSLKIASVSLIYGLFIEIIQRFLPYRTFSFRDLLADAAGIASACFLFLIMRRLRHRETGLAA
jgi:hypothetical protein